MTIITKKISPEWFEYIFAGKKHYELRLNDFDITEGDTLVLEEWTDDNPRVRTGRTIKKTVTYVGKFKPQEIKWATPEEVSEKGLQIISFK